MEKKYINKAKKIMLNDLETPKSVSINSPFKLR